VHDISEERYQLINGKKEINPTHEKGKERNGKGNKKKKIEMTLD